MKNNKHYSVCKDSNKEVAHFDYETLDGFSFNPKNSSDYIGVKVDQIVVVKPSMIEKVLKKKVKRKLDLYLQFIVSMLEDDDTDPDTMNIVLDDVSRYRRLIINKYQKYLDEKYINLLLKKIDILTKEVKNKIKVMEAKDEEKEQRRRR